MSDSKAFYVIAAVSAIAIIALVIIAFVMNRPSKNQPNGAACTDDSACASGYCDSGACADKPCGTTGDPCTGASNCCSQICGSDGMCAEGDRFIAVTGGYNITSSGFGSPFDTPEACQATCTGSCLGYTYFHNNTCSTTTSMPSVPSYTDPGDTSYVKQTSGQTLVLPGAFVGNYTGGVFVAKNGKSDCEAACKKAGSSSCVAYSYDQSENKCYLASDLNKLSAGSQDPSIAAYIL